MSNIETATLDSGRKRRTIREVITGKPKYTAVEALNRDPIQEAATETLQRMNGGPVNVERLTQQAFPEGRPQLSGTGNSERDFTIGGFLTGKVGVWGKKLDSPEALRKSVGTAEIGFWLTSITAALMITGAVMTGGVLPLLAGIVDIAWSVGFLIARNRRLARLNKM